MPEAPRDAGTVPSRGAGHGSPSTEELPRGRVVAGYAIDDLAGAGGMGVVYRATDAELGRTVALKLIAPERAGDPALRELFVRESLTAARLEHPNVIPIYRAGEDDGSLYIAMRFVEGASLQDLIAGNPEGLPPGRAARIVARVADALDAAHARGLVHRDVKPANILIADPDGEEHVYLTDFGLSVPTTRDARADDHWAGTLAYLAPEQIDGGPLDARTDVYALGCVLFHALTGRPPFPTADEEAALEAHRGAAPPAPSSIVPGLPPAMDAVVLRAMAKRPQDRFATAGELGRAALDARYDVALLVAEPDGDAAGQIAEALGDAGLHPLVAPGDGPQTAEGVRASGACVVVVGRSGLGEWARPGLSAARELAVHDRAFRLVLALLPGAPDPADPGLAYLATHPWVDLRAGVADGLAAGDLVRALRGADVPAGLPAESGVCPYRGLEAFREEDAALFFGREQDTAQLIERLRSTRFIAVLGPSGSGKSSLVHAGLLPAVRRGAIPGGEVWRLVEVVPGEHPLAALAAGLAQLPGAGAPSPADLAADERALDLAAARALEGRPAGERVMVVVDQLEEAFTLCADAGERAAFLGNLVYASTIPAGRVVVVTAMRADFYHRLAEHPELRSLAASQQHLVGPMDARALRRAIEEPARSAGLGLEPGLTRRILTDVADRPGTLPLLEHLLVELWRRRRERTLTLEAYAASGGVEGALARRANEVYGAMPPERQAIARRILLRLTQPGEGTEDTRRRAFRSELVTRPGGEGDVDAVLDALVGARLVTAGRDAAGGEPVVEVTHEALIRGWPELRGWIDDDRDRLRAERRLSDAAVEWERGGREDGALYRGARLLGWQERDRSALNPAELDFLAASDALAERERAARRRRTQIALGTLGGVAVVVAALAIFAFIQRSDAASQRDVARSRELAANARLQLTANPQLALLLADRAVRTRPTAQAEEILRQATFASRLRAESPGDGSPVYAVAVAPDDTVVTGGSGGVVRILSPTGDTVRTFPGPLGEVRGVAVSPDGRTIAAAGSDGTVRLWAPDGGDARVLRGHRGVVRSVSFSPDGTRLVSAGEDATVRVWPIDGGAPHVLRTTGGVLAGAAIASDGRIAAIGDEGVVHIWSAAGRPEPSLTAGTGPAFGLAFGPGGRLATASSDNLVRVWDRGATRPALVLRAAAFSGVAGVAFSRRGDLVSAGQDGTVRVWSAEGQRLAVLRGHDGEVLAARFTPEGDHVVSSGFDGTVRTWEWGADLPAAEISSPVSLTYSGAAKFTADGRSVLSGLLDGSVRSWRPGGPAPSFVLPPGPAGTVQVAMTTSRDGSQLAVAGVDGVVAVYPMADARNATPALLRGHTGPVYVMAFDRDGGRLLTGGDDGTVRIWDLATGKGRILGHHEGPVQALAVSPDGTRAATGGFDGVIRVWSLDGGSAPVELRGHRGVVYSVSFNSDGTELASGGGDRTVRVWDLATRQARTLGTHETAVYTAVFSPDGREILSAASDGPRVWDASSGIVLFEPGLTGAITGSFSPDGRRLALGTTDDRVLVVNCETCGPLAEVEALARRREVRPLSRDEVAAFGG